MTCVSSGELTSSQLLFNGRHTLNAVQVITDGTNPATVIIYDNTAASGKKLFESVVAGANNSGFFSWDCGVQCQNGIYVSVSGTGASCIVYYGG